MLVILPDSRRRVELAPYAGWPAAVHDLDRDQALALNTALASGRPLLVRGKPGTGKTQLARAAAVELKRAFAFKTLDAHTEAQDLRWRIDAVRRLSEAQIAGALAAHAPDDADALRARLAEDNFVQPGVLWRGFNWDSAATMVARHHATSDETASSNDIRARPDWASPEAGTVVLLDEIDKADPVLPNALLEVLGTGRFDGPAGTPTVEAKGPAPLVVITTNEERELSPAFLRRCVVLHLSLPTDEAELTELLVHRAQEHMDVWTREAPEVKHDRLEEELLKKAVGRLLEEQQALRRRDLPEPGQAEYLDLVRALWRLWPTDEERDLHLRKMDRFVFQKHGPSEG